MHFHDLTRRDFIKTTAAAASALAVAPLAGAASSQKAPYEILAFTKPFRQLSAAQTADLVAEVGWDGVELPVRSKDGQVLPEKVETDLPLFVEALEKKGKHVRIATTEITEVNALNERVLRTASKLGVKKYRVGFYRYSKDTPIPQQLTEIAAKLKDLAALNKELGLQAGFQNHSGNGYVGAPVWDVWTMIRDLDPRHIGYCFDIGHATLEGGETWPTNLRLAQPWLTAVFLKDFYWNKTPKGWKPQWCALGEGMVSPTFLNQLKAAGYEGPLCQHHEYELSKDPVQDYKRDLATLRRWLGITA